MFSGLCLSKSLRGWCVLQRHLPNTCFYSKPTVQRQSAVSQKQSETGHKRTQLWSTSPRQQAIATGSLARALWPPGWARGKVSPQHVGVPHHTDSPSAFFLSLVQASTSPAHLLNTSGRKSLHNVPPKLIPHYVKWDLRTNTYSFLMLFKTRLLEQSLENSSDMEKNWSNTFWF